MIFFRYFCQICVYILFFFIFFFKQKTAYEMRISDWSSDVCSSDLGIDQFDRGEEADTLSMMLDGLDTERRGDVGLSGAGTTDQHDIVEIGRASCRERVCQYV